MQATSAAGPGRWGVRRSEVKEEGQARPTCNMQAPSGPGDMSAAACPGGTVSHQRSHGSFFLCHRLQASVSQHCSPCRLFVRQRADDSSPGLPAATLPGRQEATSSASVSTYGTAPNR